MSKTEKENSRKQKRGFFKIRTEELWGQNRVKRKLERARDRVYRIRIRVELGLGLSKQGSEARVFGVYETLIQSYAQVQRAS